MACNLQRIADAAADAPDVDNDRVAAVRDALARGVYRIDARRIAEKLMQRHAVLGGGPQRSG